jgi:hypothetical protein
MSSDNGALVIPIVANQRQFNTAMKDVIRTSGATSAQVQAAFNKANPQSAKQIERFVGDQARAYDRLAQRIDPAVRASRQYDAVQDQLKIAVQAGSITQTQANDLLGQAKNKYLDVASAANINAAATKSAGVAQAGFLNVSNRARFLIGNTANQVGDMAVQWEANTNPMRIMGQQLPQVFGGFSALNGSLGLLLPLLGTAAAIGFPVVGMLTSVGEEAETTEDKMKALAESITAVNSAQDLSANSAVDLVKEYGALAEEAQEIFEINRQIASLRAQAALTGVASSLLSDFGAGSFVGVDPELLRQAISDTDNFAERLVQLNVRLAEMSDEEEGFWDLARSAEEMESALGGVETGLSGLVEAFGVSKQEAAEMLALFSEVDAARGTKEQAEAMSRLSSYIAEVTNDLEGAEDSGRSFYEQLVEATIQALELSKVDVAGNILEGAVAAGRLKEELAAALALHNRITAQDSKEYSGRGGDPRRVGSNDYTSELDYKSPADLIAENLKRSRRGGGGKTTPFFESSDKAIEKLQQQIEMIGKTRSEIAAYTLKQELLNEARKRGLDLDAVSGANGETLREQIDARAESVGKLTQKYEEASQTSQFFEDRQNDLKEGLLDASVSGESLSGVLDDVADAFNRAALQAIIFNEGPLKDLLGWGGSIFGGGSSGGLFGGGSSGGGSGGLFGGAIIPGILHSGGIAGQDGYGHGRAFPASTWANAPRYHQGGIAGLRPGEVPAILEAGEPVLPKNFRMNKGGSGSVTNHIRMSFDIEGANGDQHVKDLVTQGVTAGMNQVRQEVPMIVEDYEKRN